MSLDILSDDPDKLLNEWLGELENLIGGLEISTNAATITSVTQLGATIRPLSQSSAQDRTDSYRFSMANLEETHEAELDAILGELSLLEQRTTTKINSNNNNNSLTNNNNNSNHNSNNDSIVELRQTRRGSHSRSNSTLSGLTNSTISTISSVESGAVDCEKDSTISMPISREPRTESPDNDSAFSDTVSLLSSESSASSGVGIVHMKNLPNLSQCDSAKAAKIHLALQKLEQASVRRLFVKAFSADGASKSLLVDERMTCGHVQRLLADKNHVQMEPHWSLVEHLTDLNMERLYEDHELLVDSLMLWSRDSKNRVLFLQRPDKVDLFNMPERYFTNIQMAPGSDHDEHTRSILLEEFFNNGGQVAMEGPLYLKTDSRKGWKRYHFVLRASGLYYFPKEKTKSTKDLVCLSSFVGYEVYRGIGWKKKHKSPTDYTFALKSPNLPMNSKNIRFVKMLCAEDAETLEKWVTLIRIAKHGKKILENHRQLLEDLARDEIDKLSSARSGSIGSIVSSVPSQISTGSGGSGGNSIQNGRLSRASSSSSSGCLSDDNNGFDSEFPTGTIKRKPSMKPNLPLTSMTRQLKEVGETTLASEDSNPTSPERGGTLTRRHSRRRSEESTGSNGTLKRRQSSRGSIESVNSTPSSSTPTPSNPGTPSGMCRQVFNLNVVSSNSSLNSNGVASPMETMPSCMTDSVFSLPPPPEDLGATSLSASMMSLDSLPPPPLPSELVHDFSGSQISLASLPPPPPPEVTTVYVQPPPVIVPEPIPEVVEEILPPPAATVQQKLHSPVHSHTLPQPIYVTKSIKSPTGVLKSPPYKNPPPPPYNGGSHTLPAPPPPSTKSVTFADSPVLLRRKVCFEDEVQLYANTPNKPVSIVACRDSIAPIPPPRAEATRLSTSPKRLTDSVSNPPRDFLKDLQKVMRKKWQVAQKCKLEPATTPHEVLGFRDFNELTQVASSSNYYSDSGNVSNWVQEHYGQNSLYENLGNTKNMSGGVVVIEQQRVQSTPPLPPPTANNNNNSITKKRPPPPPPKRSESTQLTTTAAVVAATNRN